MSTSAKSWSCAIWLRTSYDADGIALAAPQSEPFSPILTNKKHVEIWLRRAQAAVLNPTIASKEFAAKTEAELRNAAKDPASRALPFSKNTVYIEVNDPDATDLSFIDLPGKLLHPWMTCLSDIDLGLIQNSDLKDIALIEDLVVTHIVGENTLILMTIPMSGK